MLVQYMLVQQPDGTNRLERYSTPVPNTQNLTQVQNSSPAQNGQTGVTNPDIAENVVDITLQFYDRNQQTWRTDWDYEQQNQQQAQSQGNGAQGGGNNPNATNTSASTTTGDSDLPGSVQITLQLRQKSGAIVKYTTTIPIVAPEPQPATNSIPTSGGNGTSSTGGNSTPNSGG